MEPEILPTCMFPYMVILDKSRGICTYVLMYTTTDTQGGAPYFWKLVMYILRNDLSAQRNQNSEKKVLITSTSKASKIDNYIFLILL